MSSWRPVSGPRHGIDPGVRRRQGLRNTAQSVLLLVGMVAALAFAAWLLLGRSGLVWVAVLGGVLLVIRPRVPPRWLLSLYGAQRLPPAAVPELHAYLGELARRAALPRPPLLYYVASPLTNAFSLGRPDDAAIAVTDGLLRKLTARQVVGVLAHEISHIRAGDTAVMALSDTIGRLAHGLSYVGMLTVVLTLPRTLAGDLRPIVFSAALIALPTVVTLLQLALSRAREFEADLEAVVLTEDPEGLASALEALERFDGRAWERTMVPHGRLPDPLLLQTHPPTVERARRLRRLTPRPTARSGGLVPRHRPLRVHHAEVTERPRLRRHGVRW